MSKKNNYLYLRYGANVFRIDIEYLKENLNDYSKYLEILVADGHGKYHYEKNSISVCVAEDFDIKQLSATNDPSTFEERVVFGFSNDSKKSGQVHVFEKVSFTLPHSDKKRDTKISSKDSIYAY